MTWLLCVLVAMPGRGSFSRTQTLWPRRATASAVASPTTPPPMTAVSICSIRNLVYPLRRPATVLPGTARGRRWRIDEVRFPVVPMRVLVTGASGQLADAVLRAFADREVVA